MAFEQPPLHSCPNCKEFVSSILHCNACGENFCGHCAGTKNDKEKNDHQHLKCPHEGCGSLNTEPE